MRVFVSNIIPQPGIRLLEEAGLEITEWTEKRKLAGQELIDICQQYDAFLCVSNTVDAPFLEACKHLKVIALHSVGYDNVDVAAATRLKIPIGNTPDVLSESTAETAFLLMISSARKAFYLHKKILNGQWGFTEPTADLGISLQGKTLGIYGLGKIGYELAKKCVAAYDMKVIYHNRHRNEEAEKAFGAVKVSFEELLQQSDVLSVHTALTSETKGKFNKAAFNLMKPSAIFINTARGGIHNEGDLIEALQNETIWGAGLDVTNPEPMHADNPLLQMPSVAVLPHIGSATVETRSAMAILAARNIIAGVKGERLPNIVNPEVYNSSL
ncbi:Lactate dehydrogenase [Filimonas lacunae]|uniref:Glyoxylate/hydroxypyruvate reductase B n=1 Tax=Filimonas lacunae TaxID=477680 RepID=A0A1N7R8Y5_9BACT|nr:D-glycerate dehydrogenase [Filimonas lacunae]SIT31600.1 Lactate dehydrogenase [Filimonas lacunae]